MNTGNYISGIGHGALILWVLLGGFFSASRLPPPPEAADVSLISAEEFAALSAPQSVPSPVVDVATPLQPDVEASPVPPARPEVAPQPADAPAAEVPAPPDAVPDVPAPEQTDVADEVPVLVAPAPEVVVPLTPPSDSPQPAPAPRVAPLAVPDAPQTPDIAEAPTPRVSPDAPSELRAVEEPPAAPEQATTEIVTEAEKPASSAPSTSRLPVARPPRPVRTAEPAPTPEPASDSIADAVAAAVADTPAPAAPSAPTGPPLTGGEKDALRLAVQQCWNVGSLSTDALATTVVVAVSMLQDGKPDNGSIKMISSSGGSASAASQAFEAARRAIIRCGSNGFGLPAEKYSQWQDIEITFNPENMRIK